MKLNYKYSKLYWFLKSFSWMRVYFSPFKPIIPRFYIGKIAIGVPYFFPHKWVKFNKDDCNKAACEAIVKNKTVNKNIEEWETYYKNHTKAVPLKIGFSSCDLGWKTKWSNTDYRFEYNPVWSFVFFDYQIALAFCPPEPDHYWTCWLYYTKDTDKNKTVNERIEQARGGFPCKWKTYSNGEERLICYWDVILKNKYL